MAHYLIYDKRKDLAFANLNILKGSSFKEHTEGELF